MQHPDAGRGTDDGPQDDLSDLLAPADVQFRPAPPPPRRRGAPPVPAVPAPASPPADLTRSPGAPPPVPRTPVPPVGTAPPVDTRPVDPRPVDPPPVDQPPVDPPPVVMRGPDAPGGAPPRAAPRVPPPLARRADDVVTFGRWFQPVAGGVLPRPDPAEPDVATVRAAPGSTVHAVTAGRVRRAPVTLAAGGLEIAGDDGSTVVLVAPPETAWVRDDEDVVAGEVVGVLPTGGGADDVELRVLLIGPDGVPRDAVDALVGLPDPGELDLGPGLGADPFALDLEIAGRTEPGGAP